jgi:hypothetical protein
MFSRRFRESDSDPFDSAEASFLGPVRYEPAIWWVQYMPRRLQQFQKTPLANRNFTDIIHKESDFLCRSEFPNLL